MNKQKYYRQEYCRLKPYWQDSLHLYRSLIDSYTNSETKILDVGCGYGDFLKPIHRFFTPCGLCRRVFTKVHIIGVYEKII